MRKCGGAHICPLIRKYIFFPVEKWDFFFKLFLKLLLNLLKIPTWKMKIKYFKSGLDRGEL